MISPLKLFGPPDYPGVLMALPIQPPLVHNGGFSYSPAWLFQPAVIEVMPVFRYNI